jgi:4-aminobutyrate--pyruvate transaminase
MTVIAALHDLNLAARYAARIVVLSRGRRVADGAPATVISEEIYQACVRESEKIGVFAHGYTYSGHPVSCAVANETLKIYEERNILGHVQKVSPRFQEGLRRCAQNPLVGEVRGVGLVGAVELVKDRATKAPFDPAEGIGAMVAARAQELGLIVRAMGDSVALCPPLIITEPEIDELLKRYSRALDDTAAKLGRTSLASVA